MGLSRFAPFEVALRKNPIVQNNCFSISTIYKPSQIKEAIEHSQRGGKVLLDFSHPNQCCVTGMTFRSLSSKWPGAKARRASRSIATCDRGATQALVHFRLNPPGRGSLGEFRPRSLGQYHHGYRCLACCLKFTRTPRGHWQAIPVTQH